MNRRSAPGLADVREADPAGRGGPARPPGLKRVLEIALGAALAVALLVALPAWLHASSDARDLQVVLHAPTPWELAPDRGAPLARADVGPRRLLERLELDGAPDGQGPGLWLRTWQVTYGRRWERQVTVPVLAGPFDPEGEPWPCALAVRFSPRFFDDGKPGGEDVEAVVDQVLRAQFPFSVMGLRFAAVSSSRLRVRPVEGGLSVSGVVVLADSSRDPTELSLEARIAVGERRGDLTAKVDRVTVRWRGRTRRDPLVQLASIFVDVDAEARRVVAERLGAALAIVRLPREPLSVFPDRPSDRFTVRLCGPPEVHETGLTLKLRLVASLAAPRLDPTVVGPPHVEEEPVLPPARADGPIFEAAASAAAVQQALYAAWQGGELAAWGHDPEVLSALARKLEGRLAFDLGAVEPHLPPVVLPGTGASPLTVRLGALEIGRAGDRRVFAHGDVIARARVSEGTLGLAGTLTGLRVSCVEPRGAEILLTPCYSDVVPVLREAGLGSDGLPLDLALPARLLRVDLVLGASLVLRGLEGEIGGQPPQLRMRGEARLVRQRRGPPHDGAASGPKPRAPTEP